MAEAKFGYALPNIRTEIPGPRSRELAKRLVKYEKYRLSTVARGMVPPFWEEGKGANIYDVDGNVFIDCTSAFGVASTGHANSRVIEAIVKQSSKLTHAMADIFPHSAWVELIEKLGEVITIYENSQIIVTNTGSEAVEVAQKTAALYTGKPGVISFSGGFHGQSIGALSVTSQRDFRIPFKHHISQNTVFVPFPNPYRPSFGATSKSVGAACLDYINDILSKKEISGIPDIGAVVIEPIQGISGYIIPPEGFLAGLKEICEYHGILFIADEIFTGFGRTGAWLAVNHSSVIPDIVCIGKAMTGGMPIAACISRDDIISAWKRDNFVPLHTSTFMANPVSCASAIANINELQDHNLVDRALLKGKEVLLNLKQLQDTSKHLGHVRGKGFAIAIAMEFVKDKESKNPAPELASGFVDMAMKRGIFFLITRYPEGNVVAIAPPLVTTDEQLDFVLKTIKECLQGLS